MKTILLYCSLAIVVAGAFVAGGIEPPSKKVAALSTVSKAAQASEKAKTDELPSQPETPVSVDDTQAQAVSTPDPEPVAPAPAPDPIPAPVVNTSESDAKAFIYRHESGNRTDAINASSGACGLGQALPCSKLPCTLQDYACQDSWFTQYAYNRYGSWVNAQAFWQAHSWW